MKNNSKPFRHYSNIYQYHITWNWISYAIRIRGSNNKAKISVSEKISFPSKSDNKRIELNNIIKDAGKWDEVSDLDVYALIRKMKDKDLPQDLIEQILKFQNVEKSERIYLSKIKNRDE